MSCCVTWGLWTIWYLLYLQGDWSLKISHVGGQPCLCDEAPTKVGAPRLGQASLVGGMFCVITHQWVQEALPLSVTPPTRNSKFETLLGSAPVPLPLAGFIPVNLNFAYSSLQWVLWVLLVNYQIWGWFWKLLNFAVGATCEGSLRGCPLTSYYVTMILISYFVYYAKIRINIFAFI